MFLGGRPISLKRFESPEGGPALPAIRAGIYISSSDDERCRIAAAQFESRFNFFAIFRSTHPLSRRQQKKIPRGLDRIGYALRIRRKWRQHVVRRLQQRKPRVRNDMEGCGAKADVHAGIFRRGKRIFDSEVAPLFLIP